MFLTIDVETNGLYGEAFAVGYVLTTNDGRKLLEGIHCSEFDDVDTDRHDMTPVQTLNWMEGNVLPVLPAPDSFTTFEVRRKFFSLWESIDRDCDKKGDRLYIVADVAFPCETRFLAAVRDNFPSFSAYPLIDLSSIFLANGMDPTGTYPRNTTELPAHNPLNDARQSSRLLHEMLRGEDRNPMMGSPK